MKKWFAAVLLAALVLTGCGPKQPEAHEAQLFAMDTLMSLRIWGDEVLVTQTEDTLRSLEALLSATSEDSDIARLNRDGTAELQPQTADLLQQALDCATRTGGAFDPTVYPLVCLWGFPSGKYHVPTEAELTRSARAHRPAASAAERRGGCPRCGLQRRPRRHRQGICGRAVRASAGGDRGAGRHALARRQCADRRQQAGRHGMAGSALPTRTTRRARSPSCALPARRPL